MAQSTPSRVLRDSSTASADVALVGAPEDDSDAQQVSAVGEVGGCNLTRVCESLSTVIQDDASDSTSWVRSSAQSVVTGSKVASRYAPLSQGRWSTADLETLRGSISLCRARGPVSMHYKLIFQTVHVSPSKKFIILLATKPFCSNLKFLSVRPLPGLKQRVARMSLRCLTLCYIRVIPMVDGSLLTCMLSYARGQDRSCSKD